ncbi:hypothetical protein [Burkholderia ubonensis]|uniref:hypothetical protein n=1 Tax=Burkholderia ubonensis TaxID=101571 RepID=UPI000A825B39|nr:hypothetical protein [Burkholderia ubonensis]
MNDQQQSRDDALTERDTSKTNAEQGLYRKFDVRRVDGSDQPGGKHHDCEYFVLDLNHDGYARAALRAYARACAAEFPVLAADLIARYGPDPVEQPAAAPAVVTELARMTRMFHAACHDLGLINEALGLDPDDGGAAPILDAIAELKGRAISANETGAEGAAIAWMRVDDPRDCISDAKKRDMIEHAGSPGARLAENYSIPLGRLGTPMAAAPADERAAFEIDAEDARAIIDAGHAIPDHWRANAELIVSMDRDPAKREEAGRMAVMLLRILLKARHDRAAASPAAEGMAWINQARAALEPFAAIGQWLFARPLPDETPVVDVRGLHGQSGALTRGMFKAAHAALQTAPQPAQAGAPAEAREQPKSLAEVWDSALEQIKTDPALLARLRAAIDSAPADARSGDAIARSKRILALVDDYHESATTSARSAARHALRVALMDEFETARPTARVASLTNEQIAAIARQHATSFVDGDDAITDMFFEGESYLEFARALLNGADHDR